jgi:hypothetical protein
MRLKLIAHRQCGLGTNNTRKPSFDWEVQCDETSVVISVISSQVFESTTKPQGTLYLRPSFEGRPLPAGTTPLKQFADTYVQTRRNFTEMGFRHIGLSFCNHHPLPLPWDEQDEAMVVVLTNACGQTMCEVERHDTPSPCVLGMTTIRQLANDV